MSSVNFVRDFILLSPFQNDEDPSGPRANYLNDSSPSLIRLSGSSCTEDKRLTVRPSHSHQNASEYGP